MCWQCWRLPTPGQRGLWVLASSMQAARSSPRDRWEGAHLPCSAGTSLSWWATEGWEVKDGTASPWAELCWEVDEQLPLDKAWQRTGSGDVAVGPAVPCVGQMLCGGQQVTLVLAAGPTRWSLVHRATCLSSSLAFLPGIPHRRFAPPFFPLPFQTYFLNFIFIIPRLQPPQAPLHLSRGAAPLTPAAGRSPASPAGGSPGTGEPGSMGTAGKWCLSISPDVTFVLDLFPHLISCLLGARPI